MAALEGAHASVIGGAPAAAVVFARDVDRRTQADERVVALRKEMGDAHGMQLAELRRRFERLVDDVRSEKLGEVAAEFDGVHDVERARRVGSVDRIIPPARPSPLPRRRARTRHASLRSGRCRPVIGSSAGPVVALTEPTVNP